MTQGELVFDVRPLTRPAPAGASPVGDPFGVFLATNPDVYGSCVAIARDLKSRGLIRFGMRAIFERLRWMYALQTKGEDFNLNNTYTAPMARLIMRREPDLVGFFEIRGTATTPAAIGRRAMIVPPPGHARTDTM